MVALAVLAPIVASQGGNATTQTMTVGVRALATRELTDANAWRVILRELSVGALNGLAFAVITGVAAWAWFNVPGLGIVIGLAMMCNLIAAALGGILIPLGCTGSSSTRRWRRAHSSPPSPTWSAFSRSWQLRRSGLAEVASADGSLTVRP